jgi:hypothetical protein
VDRGNGAVDENGGAEGESVDVDEAVRRVRAQVAQRLRDRDRDRQPLRDLGSPHAEITEEGTSGGAVPGYWWDPVPAATHCADEVGGEVQ